MLTTMLPYLSGLAFVAPNLDAAAQLGTSIVLLICHGIMCRLFASNNGYPKNLWTVLGFVFGIWAVAILIILPRRPPPR